MAGTWCSASGSISTLYMACRNGDLDTVQQLLTYLSLDEINQVEPNGSTSLHAASYYNYPQIVKLLLDKGATRTTKNKYECTPFDEAASPEIKQLFLRSAAAVKERFSTDSPQQTLEWVSGMHVARAQTNRNVLSSAVSEVNSILHHAKFQGIEGRSQIQYYLEEYNRTKDSKWLIKAYSAETGFYRTINEALAQGGSNFSRGGDKIKFESFHSFIGCLFQDKSLKKYAYSGKSYRGMKLSQEDFKKNYRVEHAFLIKPFTSTSKRRDVAEQFALAPSSDPSRSLSLLCIYTIPETNYDNEKYRVTSVALDISSMSEYPDEEEVLIMPHVAFYINSNNQLPSGLIEIQMSYFNL